MTLPEYIIDEESDDCSDCSLDSDDGESDDSGENCEIGHIPKGSLQGRVFVNLFLEFVYICIYVIPIIL